MTTKNTASSARRRRRDHWHALTLVDDAVMLAIDYHDCDPDEVRDRVDRMIRWLAGEDVEPGEVMPSSAAVCH